MSEKGPLQVDQAYILGNTSSDFECMARQECMVCVRVHGLATK